MIDWIKRQTWMRNFYVWTGAAWVLWMIFFDGNNWRMMVRTYYNLTVARDEKAYYQQQKEAVLKERNEVMGSPELLEKFARERYLMKKPNEDLFLVEEVEK